MNLVIHDENDLRRANIQLAWSFTHRMTAEHFHELCRVTIQQIRRDAHVVTDAVAVPA